MIEFNHKFILAMAIVCQAAEEQELANKKALDIIREIEVELGPAKEAVIQRMIYQNISALTNAVYVEKNTSRLMKKIFIDIIETLKIVNVIKETYDMMNEEFLKCEKAIEQKGYIYALSIMRNFLK